MSSSEDKCEVSKYKHKDRRKLEYFREAINSTKGRKGKSKPPLGGVYKDIEPCPSFRGTHKDPTQKSPNSIPSSRLGAGHGGGAQRSSGNPELVGEPRGSPLDPEIALGTRRFS
ncbi:hypothetical protein F2Q69_00023019 [Brassica cretica]|uniref:Uncharacterized protein n=1 Tax=Brassica cretica TaxID=69181 RepID=A0A8S9Q2R1_BRACR|nr:hypothetical protein F2Q69_00023019 [Brassica cretica]